VSIRCGLRGKYKDRAIAVYFLRIIASDNSNPMQKFFLILIFVLTVSIADGYSQNRSIQFIDKPWQEIVAMAKQQNKMIFLDAFASWCGPCKWMAANMFTNDTVADYYNKTFLCASIDMEKGDGLTLRQKYQVRAYPSLLFINGNEEMVHEKVGAPQKVQEYLRIAGMAQDPDQCMSAIVKKYNAGDRSPQLLKTYLFRLQDAYMATNVPLKKYFDTQKESDLLKRENWNLIYLFVSDVNDPVFDFLVRHQAEFGKLSSKDSVNSKISEVYVNSLRNAIRNANGKPADTSYLVMKKKVQAAGLEGTAKILFTTDMEWYQTKGKNQEFMDLTYENLDKYYADDYKMLSRVSWIVSTMTSDPKYLEKSISWSKKSVSLREEPFNTDIYAAVLYKAEKKEEAIKQEKKAIALAQKRNVSTTSYEEQLKRFEAGQ
jgi:thiol-disulfide isomerase/thioredoxin